MASHAEKLRLIEEMTADVDSVQKRVLAEILGRNAEAEYLAKCGLDGDADRATFKAKVPMVTYDDLQPYIQRVADGDRSPILSAHPISEFLTSSGTSGGERKLMPFVKDEQDRRQLFYSLIMSVLNKCVPGIGKGKGLFFLFVKSETKTQGGLPARTALTSYFKSEHFKNRSCDSYYSCTSPTAAVLCADVFQAMYAQMVCGLCQRHDMLRVGAVFASGLLRAIHFLQQNWEDLAADIKACTLNPRVNDQSVRDAVIAVLRPDPQLANLIRAECSKDDWTGIIRRIWPNAKFLDTIATGSMAQYVPILNHYGGGLPIVSTMYAASECYLGINLRPMCDPSDVSYTFMPNMGYFEFLPADNVEASQHQHQLVDLAYVEAGREYELVITTYTGLNRYRVGDILRVTGFHNAAPQFRFVRRKSVLLSIESDKTDEAQLQHAVERASALLHPHGAAVLDFTSQACTTSIPGHYVIYWELLPTEGRSTAVDTDTLDRCCLEMEEVLNAVYRQSRVADGSIGPLEIRIVKPGTFEDLMEYAVSCGTSVAQYKVPRCVTAPAVIELLDSHVVSSHFSPALPRWE